MARNNRDSFTKGTQGINDGSHDAWVGKNALEGGIYKPKTAWSTGGKAFSASKRILIMLVIGGLAYLGYQYGVASADFAGSDRPAFFALVGGYAAILILVARSGGLFSALIVAGLLEFVGHMYLGGSIHQHILNAL